MGTETCSNCDRTPKNQTLYRCLCGKHPLCATCFIKSKPSVEVTLNCVGEKTI